MVVGVALAALALRTKKIESQAGVGPVVRGENYQGVLTQSELDQGVLDPSDAVIHVSHHVDEVLLPILALAVLAPWGRIKRIVREVHRVVGEKRLVLVRLNEVDQIISDDRRSVVILAMVNDLAIVHQGGFPITTAFRPRNVPDAMPVKASFFWGDASLSSQQLPLARHGRGVALGFEVIGECRFALRENAKVDVIKHVRFSGHQIHATGRAQRSRVAVIEAYALGREPIEARGREFFAPVGAETFIPDIIRHDEDDVEFL